ncbi:uncharacterized protein TNCV_3657111 [Trichonephila clavipes]|nr:uncharacterized protein TNCV_3657111 [Trichonephila clavipes]
MLCLIGYKHSLDNTRCIVFQQRNRCLTEDETFNDSDIMNNLIDYEDEHEVPDSLRADATYAVIQFSNKTEKHFLKIDTNSEKKIKTHGTF